MLTTFENFETFYSSWGGLSSKKTNFFYESGLTALKFEVAIPVMEKCSS
jgi:hypothetical protein